MDKEQAENIISMDGIANLPTVTANLERLTIDNSCSASIESKRVLRKRTKLVSTEISNRRFKTKPKKRNFSEIDNLEDRIKDYYLDKSIKKRTHNLETIYEESDDVNDDSKIRMSIKRFKRTLVFYDEATLTKVQKRRARIRRLFGPKNKCNRMRISMQACTDKLDAIKESSSKIDDELE